MVYWVGDDVLSNGLAIFMLIVVYMSWLSTTQVDAWIHEYKCEAFIRGSNAYFFYGGSEGLYASKPYSQDNKPFNGKSFIRFESITFRRTKESAEKKNDLQPKSGLVEALIVEVKDRERIGGSYLSSSAICCTPDLAKDGSCKMGEVITYQNPNNSNRPKRFQTFFERKNEQAEMVLQIEISRTGMYNLYFMCNPDLMGMVVSGRTVWRNPDGYLPGKMAPMMTVFGLMSLTYLALGLAWFLLFVKSWKDTIQLHHQIMAVKGSREMVILFVEYANLNSNGNRPMGITLWAVTLTAAEKTVSRLLVLVASRGYGVLQPILGGIKPKVLLLGIPYFVASEALGLVENLRNVNDIFGKARLVLVLPVALLDACFVLWTFSSLSQTLEKLRVGSLLARIPNIFIWLDTTTLQYSDSSLLHARSRSRAEFALYQKFTNFLAVVVLLSIIWIGYELYFNATDASSEMWRRAWIIPAFWTLLAFLLLMVLCLLWAPSHNTRRCTFSEESG